MIAFQPTLAQPEKVSIAAKGGLQASGRHILGSNARSPKHSGNTVRPLTPYLKVCIDFVIALILLVVLAPALLAIAIVVRLDGGQALYGHRRLGKDGRHFLCLKFRSMVVQSDLALQEHLSRDPAALQEWQETHKLREDPRVTRVGRFLRKTSLDELPQLLNVLRGEMSLVGPRPIVDSEVERYGQHFPVYCAIRPGITGLWQVSGRSNTAYDDRVRLDVQYVDTWSLLQDFRILVRTVTVVLSRDGAV